MSKITIKQAAKILGKSKRTLMRWDEEGKFCPKSREEVSKTRVYDRADIENLKVLLEHKKQTQRSLYQLIKVKYETNPYSRRKWLSLRQEKLLIEEKKLEKKYRKLRKEFDRLMSKPEMKRLYEQFFKLKTK